MAVPQVQGRPIELSFPLPKAPDTRIHLQLTIQKTSILLFLTTALNGETSSGAPLGSFVYALPDVSFMPPELASLLLRKFADLYLEAESRPMSLDTSFYL